MGLRKLVDKIKPAFEEGGKFAALHSTFDAFETFLEFRLNNQTINKSINLVAEKYYH